MALVDLELDADVAGGWEPAPEVGRQPVRLAGVGIVAPDAERRVGGGERSMPAVGEGALRPSRRVVQQPDVGVAPLAVQLGREAVRGDVNDATAAGDRP